MKDIVHYDNKRYELNERGLILPQPTLIVHGTGGGKSTIYQTVGFIKGRVSLIIQNMLALSSGQVSKVDAMQEKGVFAFQLDAVKDQLGQSTLSEFLIKESRRNKSTTIFLFSSPEAILRPIWNECIMKLISMNQISQICVDEVHLFVQFAPLLFKQ